MGKTGAKNKKDLITLPTLLWLHFLSYTFPKRGRTVLTLYEYGRKIQKFHKLNLAGEGCTEALEAHVGRGPNSWSTTARNMVRKNHEANPSGKATAPAQQGPRCPASTPCLRTAPTTPHPVWERRASRRGSGPRIRRLAVLLSGGCSHAVPTRKQRGILGRPSAPLGTTPSVGGAEGPLQGKQWAGGACRTGGACRLGISYCTWASRRAGALRLGVGA